MFLNNLKGMFKSTTQFIPNLNFLNNSKALSFLLIICLSVFFNLELRAQGNLMISPSRVVFERQNRIMEVNLSNTGLDSAKYTISFVQFRMNEDGAFENITKPDPGQNFSDKYIRFYPHTIMLGPNEVQIVKLQLTKTDQLEPGEYRSHLFFRSMIPQKPLSLLDIKNDSTDVSINIVPTFGISMPVIIRVGESTTRLSITDLKLETTTEGKLKLVLSLHRKGNMSAYGDLSVFHVATNGKETKIALSKGVAVYTPNLIKKVKIDIDNKTSLDMIKGSLRVTYSSQSEAHPEKFAEATLVL